MSMRAFGISHYHDQLSWFNLTSGELPLNFVEITVTHCGVCRSDLDFIDRRYKDLRYPLIPGHEIIGIITKINIKNNNKSNKKFKIGDRVGVSWQQGACKICHYCQNQQDHFCHNIQAVGLGKLGGFAEKIQVDINYIYKIPETINSAQAAPLFCAGITVFNALTHHKIININNKNHKLLKKNKNLKIGVIGLGGLGHLAVKFLIAAGYEVTVFSETAEKYSDAYQWGAKYCYPAIYNYKKNKNLPKFLSIEYFDFILSTVDYDLNLEKYLYSLKPEKKFCFVGMPKKSIKTSILPLIIGQRIICATQLGSLKNINYLLAFCEEHKISPHIEQFSFDQIDLALEHVRLGKARYRVVLTRDLKL